jgi:hypothetical protein
MVRKGKVLEMKRGEEDEKEFFLEKNRKSLRYLW